MIMLIDFILGCARIRAEYSAKEKLFELCGEDIQFSRVRCEGEYIYFTVPLYKLRKINSLLSEFKHETVRISGLPEFLFRYRKRWGLAVGLILAAIILFTSTKVIWTFNVSGNKEVSDEVIVDTLKELGCTYGTWISKIDFDMLCNDFLIECPDVAWISVNMDGTHANVEVRETLRGKSQETEYNNIVASGDGQIIQITAYGGKKQVAIGDVVRKGDLLISAIGTFGEGRNKIEGADGLVLAETTVEFVVEIPYKTEMKVSTGNFNSINKLKIFDFYINLFVNSGIPYEKYDKIIENNQVELFGTVKLPLWLEIETSSEYYTEMTRLTEEEARLRALSEYRLRLHELSASCEILNLTTRHESSGDTYRIYCQVFCICDIAEAAPITVKE